MKVLYILWACFTAMCGYTIHGSLFWSIMDWMFWPFAIVKWLVCHELTLSVVRNTFTWFFN